MAEQRKGKDGKNHWVQWIKEHPLIVGFLLLASCIGAASQILNTAGAFLQFIGRDSVQVELPGEYRLSRLGSFDVYLPADWTTQSNQGEANAYAFPPQAEIKPEFNVTIDHFNLEYPYFSASSWRHDNLAKVNSLNEWIASFGRDEDQMAYKVIYEQKSHGWLATRYSFETSSTYVQRWKMVQVEAGITEFDLIPQIRSTALTCVVPIAAKPRLKPICDRGMNIEPRKPN